MTYASVASSLGCEPRLVAERVSANERGLSFEHRFTDWIKAPLGEIPWRDLGIRAEGPLASDELLRQGCHFVFERLAESSGVFKRHKSSRLGLFVGTTTCGINGLLTAAARFAEKPVPFEPLLKPEMQQAWITQELVEKWRLRGPVYTLSSSCATSAQALGLACDAVRADWIDAAIVLGADVLNLVTICGFEALQILDHDWCRPFSPERAGINLGEAVAAVVLEKTPVSEPLALIKSYAAVTEAYHMTQPAPAGVWMRACMEQALSRGGCKPAAVSYLNPHGTGTQANDEAERQAVTALFGDESRLHPTKGLSGHTLGASGVFELIITALMLQSHGAGSLGLKNSFGFGGANVSILLEGGKA